MNSSKDDLNSLENSLNKIKISGPAPVNDWNPKYCGDIDIEIKKNGDWFHNGKKIDRKSLIKVFSNILKKENNKFYLVTPFEKVGIRVEDAPFLINNLQIKGCGKDQIVIVETNINDRVIINKKHGLNVKIDKKTFEPTPYVIIRNNLEGLIDRKNFYRLIDKLKKEEYNKVLWYGIWSEKHFFPIQKAIEVEN